MKVFVTTCVAANGDDIRDMVDQAAPIDFHDFSSEIGEEQVEWLSDEFGYSDLVLKMEEDCHVRFFRSKYKGIDCVFMLHSAIEYVFAEVDS